MLMGLGLSPVLRPGHLSANANQSPATVTQCFCHCVRRSAALPGECTEDHGHPLTSFHFRSRWEARDRKKGILVLSITCIHSLLPPSSGLWELNLGCQTCVASPSLGSALSSAREDSQVEWYSSPVAPPPVPTTPARNPGSWGNLSSCRSPGLLQGWLGRRERMGTEGDFQDYRTRTRSCLWHRGGLIA